MVLADGEHVEPEPVGQLGLGDDLAQPRAGVRRRADVAERRDPDLHQRVDEARERVGVAQHRAVAEAGDARGAARRACAATRGSRGVDRERAGRIAQPVAQREEVQVEEHVAGRSARGRARARTTTCPGEWPGRVEHHEAGGELVALLQPPGDRDGVDFAPFEDRRGPRLGDRRRPRLDVGGVIGGAPERTPSASATFLEPPT